MSRTSARKRSLPPPSTLKASSSVAPATPDEAPNSASIAQRAKTVGLDPWLLYETLVDLSDEGLFTATCINAAAGVLLNDLGLPGYFYAHIPKATLKTLLVAIAGHLKRDGEHYALMSRVAHVHLDIQGGLQARIATRETRDQMEVLLDPLMFGSRVEYYYGPSRRYYTYIIKPEPCKPLKELGPKESPFAFAASADSFMVPEETRHRYEQFLELQRASTLPVVDCSTAPATGETRIMIHDDFVRAPLPVIRRLLYEHGLTLNRGYWETYRAADDSIKAVASLYVAGTLSADCQRKISEALGSLLACGENDFASLYINGTLSYHEMLFAVSAFHFAHHFVFKPMPLEMEIMTGLQRPDHREAFARHMYMNNRNEFTRSIIREQLQANPDLIKQLYAWFEARFDPGQKKRPSAAELGAMRTQWNARLASQFMEDSTGGDLFRFLFNLISETMKTNFYLPRKRSFAFRLMPNVMDPIVFPERVFGIFFVVGHYSVGTHIRAEDIARGGLRLLRVTPANYENELDNMVLLNFALGPRAQRLKHKDICESGSKGVVAPQPPYAKDGLNALLDFAEGIMDVIMPSPSVVDHLGRPEMIFFGPDEGTAGFMDAVAYRAQERGYKYWRTLTTGKSIGLPHDTYGTLDDGRVFGLLSKNAQGVDLQINCRSSLVTLNMSDVDHRLAGHIDSSGMTTTGIMASFRTLIGRKGGREEDLPLMMTGGPDGDLGANQIQCYKGKICLIIDGGSVLFDPSGLDKSELRKIAFARHTEPRLNSLAYPVEKLSPEGFRVRRMDKQVQLPDGTLVEDGALFHRIFLTEESNRRFVEKAGIRAFIPCGGFKDTINPENVGRFIAVFKELQFIVEGANVFFDDGARKRIAAETGILQIKDSSANKGGVASSSIAEVLTGFLLGNDYEKFLVKDPAFRTELIREVVHFITQSAQDETHMLLDLYAKDASVPLYMLSIRTSEQIFELQNALRDKLDVILKDRKLTDSVLGSYIPPVLIKSLGMAKVNRLLNGNELSAYRDVILTKKLASTAFYRHAADWNAFRDRLLKATDKDLVTLLATEFKK